jgi:hypothetical protein
VEALPAEPVAPTKTLRIFLSRHAESSAARSMVRTRVRMPTALR